MQNPRAHFVVHLGADLFDVIVGRKLNRDPLNLADANKIARRSTASVSSVIGNLVTPYTQPTPFACNDEHDRRRRREMT
jgi:hypothetical protein